MSFIQPNTTYSLTNVKGGTCIDLSGADNVSIIGYGYHGGSNQRWFFESAGEYGTFYIRSTGSGQYLSPEGDLRDGQKLIGGGAPYPWRVEDDQDVDRGVRIFPTYDTHFCVDLSDHGNSNPGTPIELWGRWEGQNQVWRVQNVE